MFRFFFRGGVHFSQRDFGDRLDGQLSGFAGWVPSPPVDTNKNYSSSSKMTNIPVDNQIFEILGRPFVSFCSGEPTGIYIVCYIDKQGD